MMRSYLWSGFVLTFLIFSCVKTERSSTEVCDSWPADTIQSPSFKAIDRIIDRFARSLDPKRSINENATIIADWLKKQPCIQQVGIPQDIVATEPPGMDLIVVHRNGSRRTFSMLFGQDHVKLSNSY